MAFGKPTALLASFLLLAAATAAAAQAPVPIGDRPPAGVAGGAISLPRFDLTGDGADLQSQIEEHRRELTAAQQGPVIPGVPKEVLVEQLQLRLRLLEIFATPLPAADREQHRASLAEQLAFLQDVLARGKDTGIGPSSLTTIEARVAELQTIADELNAVPPPAPVPLTPQPEAPAPAPPAGPPVPPAPAAEPPPPPAPTITMGDFMSAMNGMTRRIEEVRALDAIDPRNVHVVDVTTLFPGNNRAAVTRAINRSFFGELHAFINQESALIAKLEEVGVRLEDVIAITALEQGQIVIFHAGAIP